MAGKVKGRGDPRKPEQGKRRSLRHKPPAAYPWQRVAYPGETDPDTEETGRNKENAQAKLERLIDLHRSIPTIGQKTGGQAA